MIFPSDIFLGGSIAAGAIVGIIIARIVNLIIGDK